jgi:hypothetical protein
VLQTDFQEVYDPAAFSLVHIDTDGISAAALHNHWDQYNPTFPVLVGCQNQYNGYGDGYIPYNVVIDTEGVIRYTDSGFDEEALHSIIQQYQHVDYPVFAISSLAVIGDDNGDGRPDGGETVAFQVALRNSPIGEPATDCSVTMTCSDPAVTVTQATVDYPGSTPGQVVTGEGNFAFTVAAGIQPHWATFNFHTTAHYAGGTVQGDIEHVQRMGRPPLLVVDSDGGLDDNETFMSGALEALAVEHDLWYGLDNPLAAAEMARYQTIFWLGGLNQSDVTTEEETGLRDFLAGGGKLMLSSQYMSDNPARADFLADIFGVTVSEPDGGSIFVIDNLAGDPWFGGTAFVVSGNQAANNNEEPDVLSVSAPGTVFGNWRQNPHAGQPAAVYTTGAHTAIFCGFPVEASRVHNSVTGSMNVQAFAEHVLNFFSADDLPAAPELVRDFRLTGATPNPFNPTTRLDFAMARGGRVVLSVHNVQGQLVERTDLGLQAAGAHSRVLDGDGLASGIYLVRLSVDGLPVDAMKVMLVR